MNLNLLPFSTIASGEAMMRIGLGSLMLQHLSNDAAPKELRSKHLTLDTADDINQRLSGTFDINFPPVAISSIYELLSTPPAPTDQLLVGGDLYGDTVVFNLYHRLPVEPDWEALFSTGNHRRIADYLVITQGGKSQFFRCGGPRIEDDVDAFFLDWGKVGSASLKDIKEQYEHARVKDVDVNEADEVRNADRLNWLIGNALIANFVFTAVCQQ